jgi:outer membrane receptor protein involved in Fe transport
VQKLFSGEYTGAPLSQLFQDIESHSSYHFYYKAEQFDSLSVSLKFKDLPIRSLLDLVFKGTDFHYAIDEQGHVFVIRKYKIETELPAGFFRPEKYPLDTGKTEDFAIVEYSAEEEKNEKLKTSLENKLYQIGIKSNTLRSGNATIAGYVRDIRTGETISGAAVYIDNPPIGVTTDQFGYFSFTLPRGRHVLRVSSVGMKDTKRQVMLYSDGKLNIDMQEFISNLKAVTIISEKNSNIRGLQMGVERLNIRTIKQVPMVFGEADVLRAVMALPGVTSVGEGSTGFNVRGSSADQNLILFSDATVYNPSHFFGFFSAFNPDAVKDVELYKSGIPEKYGGRLASVLDITSRDGNQKKFSGAGGIGPLTARLTLEGPIGNDKTTFLIGGRATYSDWLLKTIPNPDYSQSSASFYDANLHITHEINAKNTIYLTGYLSSDQFRLNSDTLYRYANKNLNLKWKHIFNNKFYGVMTGGYDGYDYEISSRSNPVNAYKFSFAINQSFLKADFTYNLNSSNALDFGISSIYYQVRPGSMEPLGDKSLVAANILQNEQALESAVYLGDHITFSPRFSVNAGIRYSYYDYLGPRDVYNYVPGSPREVGSITDTVSYGPGKSIKTYQGPEYRIAARYVLSDNSSVKASYNTLRQYIHLLSNTAAISPTDIWKLSDPNIKPLTGDQISLGFYQNFKSNTIEASVELYYKHLYNYLDFKSGAQVLLNPHIETDILTTRGKAYGVEFMLKKLAGKLNGWVSYAYARTLLQADDPLAGQTINNGNWYPSNFDKPNNVNFVGNYKISHRFSISLNLTYSTGRPITLPVAIYYLAGSQRVYYSDRNEYRVPDYFRTDISMNIEGNHKIKKFKHSSWTLGIYNVTARQNPYSIYFVEENGVIKGYKLSIFGTAIPFVTYNFRF